MALEAGSVYEFGAFRLDPAERQLRRDGQLVSLTPKAFDTLQTLVARAGHAIRKDHLMSAVWPDANVGDATLAQNIFALRKVLGDDAIETVPKFGYRFATLVRVVTRTPECCLRWGGRHIPLLMGENIVGRDTDVQVLLDAATVSRRHARITVTGVSVLLEDLGSKNGTFVGGERLTAPARLVDRDLIGFGSLSLTFHERPPLMSTETQPPGEPVR
jgi:DNA-binding winged helix-turn-helix (wHTH) protein